jgi:hypothetical protein
MALVREKLGKTGFEASSEYQRMLKKTRERLRRKDNAKPFLEALQPIKEDVLKPGTKTHGRSGALGQ